MRYCINTSNVNIINIGMNTIIFILMINIIILINMIDYSESDSCVNVFEFQFLQCAQSISCVLDQETTHAIYQINV